MNSRQRRREADRRRSWVPLVATLRAASAPQDDPDNSESSAGDDHPMQVTSSFRPAGISDPDDLSDVELPELSDGAIQDLDIDPAPSMDPGPAPAVLPEVHHVDAAVRPDAPMTYAEAGSRKTGPYALVFLAGSQPQRSPRGSVRTPGNRHR